MLHKYLIVSWSLGPSLCIHLTLKYIYIIVPAFGTHLLNLHLCPGLWDTLHICTMCVSQLSGETQLGAFQIHN